MLLQAGQYKCCYSLVLPLEGAHNNNLLFSSIKGSFSFVFINHIQYFGNLQLSPYLYVYFATNKQKACFPTHFLPLYSRSCTRIAQFYIYCQTKYQPITAIEKKANDKALYGYSLCNHLCFRSPEFTAGLDSVWVQCTLQVLPPFSEGSNVAVNNFDLHQK